MKFQKSVIRFFLPAIILCMGFFQNCMDVPRDNAADRGGDNYNDIYSDKRITAFSLVDPAVIGVINETESTIIVPVLNGTDVRSLAAEFTTNAESVTIYGREQRSGITVNDFTSPLYYTVTAYDGSSREYIVFAEYADFSSFSVTDPVWGETVAGIIDHDSKTITVDIPYYMDISNLIVDFETTGEVQIDGVMQTSGEEKDFISNTFDYEIFYGNEMYNVYTVTVDYKVNVAHFAGSPGGAGSGDGVKGAASFNHPSGIISDFEYLYVTDAYNHTIRKIQISTGAVTTLAGSPGQSGTADGTGNAARFNCPAGITIYGDNLYVTDTNNHTIRKIVISTGVVTSVAGLAGTAGTTTDVEGSEARFNYPTGITTDGTNLYVCDRYSNTIRQIVISSTYFVTTLVSGAGLNDPKGIIAEGGNLYVADFDSQAIRKIVISTGAVSSLPLSASIFSPDGITTDGTYLYVTNSYNRHIINRVLISDSSATVTTVSGSPGGTGVQGSADGTLDTASFRFADSFMDLTSPGITISGTYFFICDTNNNTIRRLSLMSDSVDTFAGLANEYDCVDDAGSDARFFYPRDIATDGNNLYVADTYNHSIRSIEISSGNVSTVAGSGSSLIFGYDDDTDGYGGGITSTFYYPSGITAHVTPKGINLYVADTYCSIIRKIAAVTGLVTTFAGEAYFPGTPLHTDGEGTTARFYKPEGIVYLKGSLYVCDTMNHLIRKIAIGENYGTVTTIAGAAETPGSSDGTGSEARFNHPTHITTDGTYLYVADQANHIIRRIELSGEEGIVTTIAGTASSPGCVDGNGADVRLAYPYGIGSDGVNLYISEPKYLANPDVNYTIRKIVISTGAVTTIAGVPGVLGRTDGDGLSALFNNPYGMVYDNKKLYVCDFSNNCIRVITP